MAELTTVRGITGHPELGGPPFDQPSESAPIPPWDKFNHGVDPVGNEDASSRRYFIETKSTSLADIVTRESDVGDDGGE